MTALIYLRRSAAAETLKLKNTLALLAAAGAPLFIVFLSFCIYYFKGHLIVKPSANPWLSFTQQSLQIWAMLFMPLYIALAAALVCAIEHQSNTWKQLYSLPIPRWVIYFTKMAVFVGLILGSMLLFFLLHLGAGYLLSWLRPELGFQNFNLVTDIARIMTKITLAALGIMAIQYYISFRFRNFIFPIGLGFVFTVAGMILLRWEHIHYYPYIYPFFSFIKSDPKNLIIFSQEVQRSLMVFFGVALLGYLEISRRDIT